MKEKEKNYLKEYDSSKFEKPSLTADVMLLALDSLSVTTPRLMVLLVKRLEEPYKGEWALPGSFVGIDETIDGAARRVLEQKVGITKKTNVYMEQLYTFGSIDRDPRMRIISTSYIAMISTMFKVKNDNMMWVDLHDFIGGKTSFNLAFDHKEVLETGINRLMGKVNYTQVAFGLIDKRFTLLEAQKAYEAILNEKLHKSNFRRDVKELTDETDDVRVGGRGPTAKLFILKKGKVLN